MNQCSSSMWKSLGCGLLMLTWSYPLLAAEEGAASGSSGYFRALVSEQEEQLLSSNEPMYFVVGGDEEDITAHFQLSFKYRLFDRESDLVKQNRWMDRFYFGYTQTTLWNLSADSRPFEDSSYRPSFFWQEIVQHGGWFPDAMRMGYEHESNGQSGEASRSMDTLFFQPAWFFSIDHRELMVTPKFYAYLVKGEENTDVTDYRGYVELMARYGDPQSWELSTRIRPTGRPSIQLNLSYPMRNQVFARVGGFFYLQLFHGYGESFVHYNVKDDLQVRLGFAFVR